MLNKMMQAPRASIALSPKIRSGFSTPPFQEEASTFTGRVILKGGMVQAPRASATISKIRSGQAGMIPMTRKGVLSCVVVGLLFQNGDASENFC